ncbi:hypothetical protein BKA80DRAFT_24367 [Phyllosticta citrichinensis]
MDSRASPRYLMAIASVWSRDTNDLDPTVNPQHFPRGPNIVVTSQAQLPIQAEVFANQPERHQPGCQHVTRNGKMRYSQMLLHGISICLLYMSCIKALQCSFWRVFRKVPNVARTANTIFVSTAQFPTWLQLVSNWPSNPLQTDANSAYHHQSSHPISNQTLKPTQQPATTTTTTDSGPTNPTKARRPSPAEVIHQSPSPSLGILNAVSHPHPHPHSSQLT